MKQKKHLFFLMTFLFLFQACGGDTEKKENKTDTSEDDKKDNWLVRQSNSNNTYMPQNLETIIDNLVEELNKTEPNPSMKLAFIPKNLGDYWTVTVLGANRAISELGVIGSVLAPESHENMDVAVAQQVEYLNQHIENGYEGIGLAPLTREIIEGIDEAVEKGSIIVTFDSDESTSSRHFYIGTNNFEAGRTAGSTLVELIGANPGTVIILGHEDEAWVDGFQRTDGARIVLEEAGHTVVIRQADWANPNSNIEFMTEALENADPPAVGMLGVFSNAFQCAQAALEVDMIDQVKIAAFDSEIQTLEYLAQGHIQATHIQRQYYMGYLTPYILYSSIVLGLEETKTLFEGITISEGILDTGLDVVFMEQLNDYNSFLSSLGIH